MVDCKFSDVIERDMDLLFMEEFVCCPDFLNLFLQKVNLLGASLISVEQSKIHKELGESDITVIVEKDGVRYGLLIEDKVDAVAQPEQAERYFLRGKAEVENRDYAFFYVFIVAPKDYLNVNEEAKKYPKQVSYEECLTYFESKTDPRSDFKRQQIENAIIKQRNRWQVVTDDAITLFWKEYDSYQEMYFKKLDLIKSEKGKPSKSFWRTFGTGNPKIHIVHKAERGCVDMEFSGLGKKAEEFSDLCSATFGNLFVNDLQIENTGKTVMLRCLTPMDKIDFSRPFEEQKKSVKCVLEEVERLRKLLDDLPKEKLYALFE